MLATAPTTSTTPPPSTGLRPWRWTREQYYELGKLGFFQGKRVELLYGEIVEMSPINWPHALAVGLVSDALALAFPVGFYVSVQQPFAVPGSVPGSEPQPDVAVIPGSRRNYATHPDRAAIIVEVANTTFATDSTTKAELYATASILDYWLLDLERRQLHVFRDPVALPAGLGATAYRKHVTLAETDTASPLAAPTANIFVRDLLP